MTALKVGGQCEGYGGTFRALQQLLNVEHAWYAEVDEAASKVLAHHFPGVPNHGDITAFDWTAAERVDVMTAGWPCQPFSHAGKRAGTGDARHLWPTGVLPAVSALMPPLFIGENVPGLLTIEHGQVFARVLADLDDLGYAVSWTTVGACRVGACHHRHRVFLAATLAEVYAPLSDPIAHRNGDGWGPAQSVLFGDSEAVRWPAAGLTSAGTAWETVAENCGFAGSALPTPLAGARRGGATTPDVAQARMDSGRRNLEDAVALLPTPTARDSVRGAGRPTPEGRPLSEVIALLPTPRVAAVRTGRSAVLQSGSAPSLEQAFEIARGLLPSQLTSWDEAPHSWQPLPTPTATPYGTNQSPSAGASVRPSLDAIAHLLPTPRASDAEKGGPNQRGSSGDVMLPAAVQPERFGKYALAVRRHEQAYALRAPDPTEPGRAGRPRLSAAFPEFMMGLPSGWLTDVVGRKDALKLAGNGVNPRQAAYALSTLPTFRAAVKALGQAEVMAA